ncbi:hypothetical protein [Candidatus Chloroploca asiatica]|nr:hypothetical protein [Candidatus Chloroploca asiatica]
MQYDGVPLQRRTAWRLPKAWVPLIALDEHAASLVLMIEHREDSPQPPLATDA